MKKASKSKEKSAQEKLEEIAREEERKEEIRQKLQKKKESEERAHAIVLRLLENNETLDWIRDSMHYLTPAHFDDIVEERSIVKLCGYVTCSNVLKDVLKQQYKISTKRNQVIDITERKKFCSTTCFNASNYLKEQVSSEPLWLRETRSKPVKFFHEVEPNESTKKKVDKNSDKSEVKDKLKNETITVPKQSKTETLGGGNGQKNNDDHDESKAKKIKQPVEQEVIDFATICDKIGKDWWSSKSRNFVLGISDEISKPSINVAEKSEQVVDECVKVQAFLKGEIDYSFDKLQITEKAQEDKVMYLPKVDKNSQMTHRRSILLENLKRGFVPISVLMDARWEDIRDVKKLVSTFNLTAQNIVLDQRLSIYCCIFILHILKSKDERIHALLSKPEYKIFQEGIMSKLDKTSEDIDIFVDTLLTN